MANINSEVILRLKLRENLPNTKKPFFGVGLTRCGELNSLPD